MRYFLIIGLMASTPAIAQAEEPKDCGLVGSVVQTAVEARIEGDSKRKTRRMLSEELDKDTGAMLAEFIYGLPDEHLNEEVAQAFQAQCEQL